MHEACSVNTEQLIANLRDPATDPEFTAHVADCQACQIKLLQMGAAAMSGDDERKACSKFRLQLTEFVATQAVGTNVTQRFAALQEHLVLCEECFALYQELRLLEKLVINDALSPPPSNTYRRPNLSFLQPIFEWVKSRTQSEGTKLIQTLRLYLSAIFLQSYLKPSAVRSDGRSKPETPEIDFDARQEELTLGAETLGELDIEVKLSPEALDNSLVRLEVRVVAIKHFAVGFGGTRVELLLAGKGKVVHDTDEEGITIFNGLLRDELPTAILEITPIG